MTVETLTCGKCGDRDAQDDYALCMDCYHTLSDNWEDPV